MASEGHGDSRNRGRHPLESVTELREHTAAVGPRFHLDGVRRIRGPQTQV